MFNERTVEDVYLDYLYYCFVVNKKLTEEDWCYYGKEEHHVWVPARDGGVLDPLNSQHLTTYQHWVAGVLQSEMLGKKCFACIPDNALPAQLEKLKVKWNSLNRTGKKTSESTKRKQSEAKKGKTRPDHVRAKIKETALQQRERYIVQQTEEMLEANRLARLGKKWFHDPVNNIEKYFHVGDQPKTWVKGRLPRGTVNRTLPVTGKDL